MQKLDNVVERTEKSDSDLRVEVNELVKFE